MRIALTQGKENWKNRGLAALFVIGLWMFLAVFFDFYYDLNDDTAMKDILSGTYTGVPDGHCIQMLYPLGWCISLFYRMVPAIPWYGIFLCGCQFLALWIGLCTLIPYADRKEKRAAWLLLFTVAAGLLFLYEFIFIQYTVTAGFMMAAALMRLSVGPKTKEPVFFRYHIITVVLIVLAFYLRTEMMLLVSPYLGLAVLWRFFSEWKQAEQTEKKHVLFLRYGAVGLLTAALMIIGLLADRAAYSSSEWQQFRQFFDDRTRVYDFYGIPDYETHQTFYEELGLSETEYVLLENYNFDLDDEINADTMHKIAEYAATHREQSVLRRLYLSIYTYIYRFLHGQELIFDLLLVVSYFYLVKIAFQKKHPVILGKLFLLFAMRSGIWIYLLYRGRVPERITHPLYLMELLMLAMMFLLDTKVLQWKKYEKSAILSMYILLFVCTAFYHVQTVSEKYAAREEINTQWQEWKTYCRENPEKFYYLDVYSSVAYSEKMFSDISPKYRNFDLPGGWCVKSPLTAQKRAVMDFKNAKDGLLSGQAFFAADVTKPERTPEFLVPWYREKGKVVTLQEIGACGSFSVFRVTEKTVD